MGYYVFLLFKVYWYVDFEKFVLGYLNSILGWMSWVVYLFSGFFVRNIWLILMLFVFRIVINYVNNIFMFNNFIVMVYFFNWSMNFYCLFFFKGYCFKFFKLVFFNIELYCKDIIWFWICVMKFIIIIIMINNEVLFNWNGIFYNDVMI